MKREDIRRYFMYFMCYSIIGWIYEVFLEVVVYKWGFTNRGVLFGPYCPVYGFGALAFIFTAYRIIKGKPLKEQLKYIPIIFILCMAIATLIELIASYLCEYFLGTWTWQTYADYKYNFQARIALSPSIRFGLGGLLFLYILQPLFEKMCDKLGDEKIKIITRIIAFILLIDCIHLGYTKIIK